QKTVPYFIDLWLLFLHDDEFVWMSAQGFVRRKTEYLLCRLIPGDVLESSGREDIRFFGG
ncbi:MAG: hypothetical protein P8Y63_13525, partial [Deltaproteobacteria bacterium]